MAVAGLPFAGQFPVARIDGLTFETRVGVPPGLLAAEKRDYGLFLLLNTLSPEYSCPSCQYVCRGGHTIRGVGHSKTASKRSPHASAPRSAPRTACISRRSS